MLKFYCGRASSNHISGRSGTCHEARRPSPGRQDRDATHIGCNPTKARHFSTVFIDTACVGSLENVQTVTLDETECLGYELLLHGWAL